MHESLHDLEGSLPPETSIFPVETAAGFAASLLGGERVQLALAVVTLVLVLAEFISHHYVFRLVG
jgi:hypothetical protein